MILTDLSGLVEASAIADIIVLLVDLIMPKNLSGMLFCWWISLMWDLWGLSLRMLRFFVNIFLIWLGMICSLVSICFMLIVSWGIVMVVGVSLIPNILNLLVFWSVDWWVPDSLWGYGMLHLGVVEGSKCEGFWCVLGSGLAGRSWVCPRWSNFSWFEWWYCTLNVWE